MDMEKILSEREDFLFDDLDKNLTVLQEECAEIIQVICKIRRFGMLDRHPEGGPNNLEKLRQECGDVVAMINILTHCDNLWKESDIDEAALNKFKKLAKWYNYGKE